MIEEPYLLPITIPCYFDADGRRCLDELWYKDLVEHLVHIRHLTLAAPASTDMPAGRMVPIDADSFDGGLRFVDLPAPRSTAKALFTLPTLMARIWKEVGRARIVHGNVAGWPIPLGWIAVPMAKLRGKFVLTNIESAPWRRGFERPWRPSPLLKAIVFESMVRLCVNISDIATFTHAGYMESMLLRLRKARGRVFNASWIDRKDIIAPTEAEDRWRAKLADPRRPLRVVFAASLIPNKGVRVLLQALAELERRGSSVAVDVYGKGELADECARASAALNGSVSLTMRGTVAYGTPFFEMLDAYDVMVVPNLSDEQPRVVYDSFSRALPVIASDNVGLVECVTDGHNGKLVPPGDVGALADAIAWAADHRPTLREWGINGLDKASALTHDQMHARRAAFIMESMKPRNEAIRAG